MIKIVLDNKGQASIELLFITLVFLVIFGSLISLVSSEADKTQTGDLGEVRMTGEMIAGTINTVYASGNGYSVNLSLTNDTVFNGIIVNGSGSSSYLYMYYGNQNMTIKLIPSSVQNKNISNGQKYTVKNINGNIIFI